MYAHIQMTENGIDLSLKFKAVNLARNLQVDETVFVPKQRLGMRSEDGSALKECRVLAVNGRTITVDVNDDHGNALSVASSAAHRNIHVLVVRIGDFETEASFLEPLTKSILQFLRVLLTDGYVTKIDVRSLSELGLYWERNHGAFSHVVIAGHGQPDGLTFAVDGLVNSDSFLDALDVAGVGAKTFISLACETGKGELARKLSSHRVCAGYLGPYQTVHGADASLFVQTFLTMHFLDGLTLSVAAKKSYDALSRCYFRLWQSGKLKVGYHVKSN